MKFTSLFVSLFSLSLLGQAAERHYYAPIGSANWETKVKEQYFCSMKQNIPYYGDAVFTRKSGQEIVFELFSQKLFLKNTQVTILADPVPWRPAVQSFEIGSFTLAQGHKPLTIHSPYASRMFQQLENAMMPTIYYRDIADQRDEIIVSISPMKFRMQLKKYRQCESTLLEYSPDFIKDFEIYFATNKAILTASAKRNLTYVVMHLKIDPSIKQIKIDAHADNRGRRRFNDVLSEKRASAVKDYLIEAGADKKLIVTDAHGERDPKYSNRSKQGRSKNRQARVQLLNTLPEIQEDKEDKFIRSDALNTPVPNFINLEHLITK